MEWSCAASNALAGMTHEGKGGRPGQAEGGSIECREGDAYATTGDCVRLNLITAAHDCRRRVTAPAVALSAAADLDTCCTPGDQDFPKVGGNLGNQNFSALKQINRGNIRTLGGACLNHVDGGVPGSNQSTPVAVDGVIYLETNADPVIAVECCSGARWRRRCVERSVVRKLTIVQATWRSAPRLASVPADFPVRRPRPRPRSASTWSVLEV
jgi:hypothetical protein